jgi:hypothetical protein
MTKAMALRRSGLTSTESRDEGRAARVAHSPRSSRREHMAQFLADAKLALAVAAFSIEARPG